MSIPFQRAAVAGTIASIAFLAPSCDQDVRASEGQAQRVLRVGHFPNVTHAHGLIGHHLTDAGKGWFEERLGDVRLEWYVYNAGPGAMEALLAGSIDLTYVGPNPALNAWVRSQGGGLRVVSGATLGGSALVVRPEAGIREPADFRGRKVATPQFGNTQDVACRAWLASHGFTITQTGGDVHVVPTANPDQISLFQRGDIDAVWTVEPWVTRIEQEAGGRIFLEEPEAITTVLAASLSLLEREPDLLQRFVQAHSELTAWIEQNPEEARGLVREELVAETGGVIRDDLLRSSWERLSFTDDVALAGLEQFVRSAELAGFLENVPDLSGFVQVP